MVLTITAGLLPFIAEARASTNTSTSGETPPLAPIDDDTAFDCGKFKAQGLTASNHTVPDVTITLGKQPSQVGLEESWTDAKKQDFLRIEYDEERDRTLRFWIPAECVSPYANEPVTAITGGPSAQYTPIKKNGTRYLQVRVVVTGRLDAVYPLSETSGWSFDVFHTVSGRVEQLLGENATSGPQWTYIDRSRLQGTNATAKVTLGKNATDPLFQYRTGNESWAVVPDEAGHPAPVYRFRKPSVNGTVFVVAEVDDPPQVRYVKRSDATTSAKGIMSDIGNAVNQMVSDAREAINVLWGGGG